MHRRRLYRAPSGRADIARRARAAGPPEPVLFLSSVQAILRHAAASLPYQPAHRTRQDVVGKASSVGDRYRIYRRIQPDKLFHLRFSQGDRADPDRLSPEPELDAVRLVRIRNGRLPCTAKFKN